MKRAFKPKAFFIIFKGLYTKQLKITFLRIKCNIPKLFRFHRRCSQDMLPKTSGAAIFKSSDKYIGFFKIGLLPSKNVCFICLNESPLNMMKNGFYLILKALFGLKGYRNVTLGEYGLRY